VFHLGGQAHGVSLDLVGRPAVGLFGRKLEQFPGVAKASREPVQAIDDTLQLRSFFPEFLRAFRVVPDARLLEFAGYLLEAFVLVIVIKDTSSRSRCVPRDL
jgi:hypothetical protein